MNSETVVKRKYTYIEPEDPEKKYIEIKSNIGKQASATITLSDKEAEKFIETFKRTKDARDSEVFMDVLTAFNNGLKSILYPPPAGITPRSVWIKERRNNLADAIERYQEFGLEVPHEWIEEFKILGAC